jgi:predicted nucleic acid-binding protein
LQDLLNAFPDEEWFISTVTVSELLQGAWRTLSPTRRTARLAFVEHNINRFKVLDFDLASARAHAELWAELARHGRTVGERDLMIAATAVSRNYACDARPKELSENSGAYGNQSLESSLQIFCE